jgi:L-asparaginase
VKIKLFITGGTIDKSYNMHNGELHFIDSHIPAMLAEARCRAELALDKIMLKDSLDMDDADREKILACCQQCEESNIIITHGTDTMVQTAQVLARAISDKTIVLTGAMIPYVFKNSDSVFNLGCAMAAVQALPAGIYIAMNGRIFNADDVVKNRDEGVFETVKK